MSQRRVVLAAAAAIVLFTRPAAFAAKTIVTLCFDDGSADQMIASRILSARGLRGTFYVSSPLIGTSGFYLSRSQLKAISKAGHEIGGHTLEHLDLTTLSTKEMRRQICEDRRRLQNWGYDVVSFAYPFGAHNDEAERVVKSCGYKTGRITEGIACADCGAAEDPIPAAPFAVRAADSVRTGDTAAQLKKIISDAETAGGGWVPIVMHRVCDEGCGDYSIKPETLADFANWLRDRADKGTVVKTAGEVAGGIPVPSKKKP